MGTAAAFVEQLAGADFVSSFNPYRDRCRLHDLADAPARRRNGLLRCLAAAEQGGVESLWVARDLGYRGGRRTGLALTDDIHLGTHAARWSVNVERATKGAPVAERTAATTWRLLEQIDERIFLWNVFPLHPHEPNDELSNRQHTASERNFGLEMLSSLIRMLRPQRIVCIGNDAASAAKRVVSEGAILPVRHPSYGGTGIFRRQISDLYGLNRGEHQPQLF